MAKHEPAARPSGLVAYKPEAWTRSTTARCAMAVVSFNSDSDGRAAAQLGRRQGGKWGGVPPAEALAFVTINPARQLGIEKRVGSLEAGKDADFVIWSGDPLSTSTIALETWIEGKKYFDRGQDLARRPALEKERAELVAKAKKMLEADRAAGRGRGTSTENAERPAAASQEKVPTRAPEAPEKTPAAPAAPPAATPTPAPRGAAP
jgi:hypothetical protein